MADELKAIQAELDSLLDRLVAHLEHDAEPTPGREDAARVVLHYAREGRSLEASVGTARAVARGRWQGPKIKPESRLGELAEDDHPERLAPLVEAMRAVWECQWHRLPLEDKHAVAMARAVDAWSNKQCQFIGESVGLELTPARQVDRRAGARERAAHEVFALHQQNPETFPLTEATFEKVGGWYGMSSRAVSRAYYAYDSLRQPREWVQRSQPRGLSENDES